ncbi:MAG: hypothetical protein E3J96_02085 [Sulfurovum sp.]|nr:MAG: hypothetical protein E3J96_02085 [Sulfurovum sp.]
MNDKPLDETESEEHIWTHGKSVSKLASSENNMNDERKEIIRQALKFDIIDIRSYAGYKGDLLVEITTIEPDVIKSLKIIAERLGLETVIQKNVLAINKIYCISPSSNAYELK